MADAKQKLRRRGGMRTSRFGGGWSAPWVRLVADHETLMFSPPFFTRRVIVRREEVKRVYISLVGMSYMVKIDGPPSLNPYFAFYCFDPGRLLTDLADLGWPCDLRPQD